MMEKISKIWNMIKRTVIRGLLLFVIGILKGSFTVAKKLHMQKSGAIALAGFVMLTIFCVAVVGTGCLISMVV